MYKGVGLCSVYMGGSIHNLRSTLCVGAINVAIYYVSTYFIMLHLQNTFADLCVHISTVLSKNIFHVVLLTRWHGIAYSFFLCL